jgi:hypothetical protein
VQTYSDATHASCLNYPSESCISSYVVSLTVTGQAAKARKPHRMVLRKPWPPGSTEPAVSALGATFAQLTGGEGGIRSLVGGDTADTVLEGSSKQGLTNRKLVVVYCSTSGKLVAVAGK